MELSSDPLPPPVPKWGVLFSELSADASEFLWCEWHGHVCVFIRPGRCQKITTGGFKQRVLLLKIATSNPADDSVGLNVFSAARPYIERRGPRTDLWTRVLNLRCSQSSHASSQQLKPCAVTLFRALSALFSAQLTGVCGQLNCNCCKHLEQMRWERRPAMILDSGEGGPCWATTLSSSNAVFSKLVSSPLFHSKHSCLPGVLWFDFQVSAKGSEVKGFSTGLAPW